MRQVDPSVSYTSYVDRQRLDAWEWVNQLPTYVVDDPKSARKTGTSDIEDNLAQDCHHIRHQSRGGLCRLVSFGDGDDQAHDPTKRKAGSPEKPIKQGVLSADVASGLLPGTGVEPALPKTGTRPST